MSSFSFRLPIGGGGFFGKPPQQRRARQQRARSASEAAASSPSGQQVDSPPAACPACFLRSERHQAIGWPHAVLQSHLEGVFKSGLTSGSLALAGDVFAQLLTSRGKVRAKSHAISERCGLV